MTTRSFIASDGDTWRAWDVVPREHHDWPTHARNHLPPAMAEGWLCFESEREKRRIHPIPQGWEEWNDQALEALRSSANPVLPRPV